MNDYIPETNRNAVFLKKNKLYYIIFILKMELNVKYFLDLTTFTIWSKAQELERCTPICEQECRNREAPQAFGITYI